MKAPICHDCGERMVPCGFDFGPVGGDFLPPGKPNSEGNLWMRCPGNDNRGMWVPYEGSDFEAKMKEIHRRIENGPCSMEVDSYNSWVIHDNVAGNHNQFSIYGATPSDAMREYVLIYMYENNYV